VLGFLQALPRATVATDAEVLFFIERHALMGRGIGYIDAHLIERPSEGIGRFNASGLQGLSSPALRHGK